MNIGIYKFGKPIYFHDNEEDTRSWSIEITQIAQIFAHHGHGVYMLGQTDLKEGDFEHIHPFVDMKFDRIYCFNGPTLKIEQDMEELGRRSKDIRLIITDLDLIPEGLEGFKKIYSQSPELHTYAPIHEGIMFGGIPEYQDKTVKYYFGGVERDRLNDILEYVYRPDCVWKGKSKFLGFKNMVPYKEHIKLLSSATSTIVIGDERYNKIGFVTPRYFEAIKLGTIAFVDGKFDPHEKIVSKDDWRRVSSYKELRQKQNELLNNPFWLKRLVALQYQEITENRKKGTDLYNALIK